MACAGGRAQPLEAPLNLRGLPSVDRLLQEESARWLIASFGRALTVEAVRANLDSARRAVRSGAAPPPTEELLAHTRHTLESWTTPTLPAMVNATGVILHTNLGRAPLSREARAAMLEASGYTPLEIDRERGGRGRREDHVEGLLTQLTGAEAAIVVNNNAAAVLLALAVLARRREVIVARSQLIEIGGGFRIPEVLHQSGARLAEVGTTNRTRIRDYEEAIGPRTALILRAHHSNFKLVGFTQEPGLAELTALAHRHDLPLLDDLGSGALLDTASFGLAHEPTVQESIQAGADVVAFSADKLLGGPQAGILAGRRERVDGMRKHPLLRALRPDKLCLAALQATLLHYRRGEARAAVPVWRMIGASAEDIRSRAEEWKANLGTGDVIPGLSTIGGGSLPEETLPTWLWALPAPSPDALATRLRRGSPAVLARIEAGALVIDGRTVLPEEEGMLLMAVRAALGMSA